ncbi:hypothetical protein QP968_10975 [Corynebacterium sp. MSK041]|uniref:hypothetical protein n=1 Tax=Corynebacterium sp. MSK041 TaxID=3050194 RepID=UPI00254F3AF7|nr:hypothetical protein [Corynebacterium sp. MSK041]MDK8796212.1 hypothetical protein [Corynebacterium sp. MSK041]
MPTSTDLPSRFDPVTDQELAGYITALTDALNDGADGDAAAGLAKVVNEHCKPWHYEHFDAVEACYLKEPRFAVRFPMFQCLERLCGQDVQLLDRMLELYKTDHRTEEADCNREVIKEFFQYLFATKGHQRHWDAIAESATTVQDVAMLEALQYKNLKSNTNSVDTWVPERPKTT